LFTAVLHALCALGGGAGGAVFCVESDGCVQIEFGFQSCCDRLLGAEAAVTGSESSEAIDDPSHVDDCEVCVDIPLEIGDAPAWRASVPFLQAPSLAGVAWTTAPDCAVTPRAVQRSIEALLPEPAPLAARRTLVLLI
jgi:hypothetical protein